MKSKKNIIIAITSDHAGFDLKERLKGMLTAALALAHPENSQQYEIQDFGPESRNRVDYPDYAEKCVLAMNGKPGAPDLGILICGSGIGMSIAANRFNHIRAAMVENPVSARLAREHNDANVLCLGSRFVAPEYALDIALAFLSAKFEKTDENGQSSRHKERVAKLSSLGQNV